MTRKEVLLRKQHMADENPKTYQVFWALESGCTLAVAELVKSRPEFAGILVTSDSPPPHPLPPADKAWVAIRFSYDSTVQPAFYKAVSELCLR